MILTDRYKTPKVVWQKELHKQRIKEYYIYIHRNMWRICILYSFIITVFTNFKYLQLYQKSIYLEKNNFFVQ